MKSEEQIRIEAKIEVLTYLSGRECNCDKSKCAEHFRHIESLKYEYKSKLEELDEKE